MIDRYHTPVLFNESVEALNLKPDSVVVDVTYGGGGHSKGILKRLGKSGVLLAFDQDEDALANQMQDERLIFVNANFRFLINFVKYYELDGEVDAIFADLGVSSHQFDTAERGFSIRTDAKLDMRMNQDASLNAHTVVNSYPENELLRIFRMYADLGNAARKVVTTICRERNQRSIDTTSQLVDLIENLVPHKKRNQFMAQVFQAIRIEVNDEVGALMDFLEQSEKVLKKGGRLVVISYHSVEDRLVKNFMRSGNFEGEFEKDMYGVVEKPFDMISRKPIVPTDEEIENNPRARSAKLRIAVKL